MPVTPENDYGTSGRPPLGPADAAAIWTEIGPQKNMLDWRLKELWGYRDLVLLFVQRDFVALYKQTILGPAWHVIQPLMTTLTYTLVFGRVAGLSTDGQPKFLFYLSGVVLWTYFASTLTKTSNTFIANASLMGKVYFHRLAIPVSVAISNLIAFGIQFLILILFWLWYFFSGAIEPNLWLLALPLVLLLTGGLALGGGIIVSALTTRYRDLTHLITFGVQLMMFATPVIYPVSMIPSRYQWLATLNPLAPVVQLFRYGLMGGGAINVFAIVASCASTVVILIVGLLLFTRIERTFMDTV